MVTRMGGSTTVDAVRANLLEAIAAKEWAPGDKLPAERELAEQLGVSRTTLREALGQLARSGHVVRRTGRSGGTFAANARVERDLSTLTSLPGHLARQGLTSSSTVVSAQVQVASAADAAALELEPEALVYEIVRVRFADGAPISLERSRFPVARFPDLLGQALGGSLYDVLATAYGVRPVRARELLEPVAAGAEDGALLGVAKDQPMLAVERIAYDTDGVPVEFGSDLFVGNRTRVVVWVGDEAGTRAISEDTLVGRRS
jgi:GntR family transcriptional regulator